MKMPPVGESQDSEASEDGNVYSNLPKAVGAINANAFKAGSDTADALEIPAASKDGFGMWKHPHEESGGRAEAAALALFSLYIYYKTLPPSITGGDSGEVMAAACSWGPAHPPGYPLFIFLAQVAMHAFAGLGDNRAYRVNLMCAVLTAAAVYNLHRAARILTRRFPLTGEDTAPRGGHTGKEEEQARAWPQTRTEKRKEEDRRADGRSALIR